ncbi:putative inner membrane protein DUF1819 [Algoriphagus boseongensis]|uniref:Putative inner membrane protein DUF1819 n=1 Tax=Algoriphagus boseongensis TaxID=1442587 RepID=A0A4R6T4D4_9BACT|nr:BrxA family protein [Algoriphagus boseongensis]TDQ15185.1 putative inner membrane protein DUF1819 [Algoriphagus boseongensis]
MSNNTYEFSFTACSLHIQEMIQFLKVEQGLIPVLEGGKSASIKRKNQEFRKRLETLNPDQTKALLEGDLITQRQLAYLSVCKIYGFFREFVLEVLREKMILMDYQVTEGEYLSFFRRKMMDHPELEELSETTEKKVKQVVFRILAEAGIINSAKEKVLQYQILEPKMIQLIKQDHPMWFEVFLLNDFEISNYAR